MKHVELIAGTTLGVLVMMCGAAVVLGLFDVPETLGFMIGLTIVLCGVVILYTTSEIFEEKRYEEEKARYAERMRFSHRKLRG